MMKYKGYVAEVIYDDSVGRLHGRVINSGAYPIATFETENVADLQREFELSINEYLASCREDGIEPLKPISGRLSLRLGTDLHQLVARASAECGMSVNRWISLALEEQLAR